MSLALHELLLCCRQLETDKATERRKEIDKFKRLLRDQETVQQLDRNSDTRRGKQLNWDTVFRFLQKYICKEIESYKSGKANVSHSTQTARQKKMQDISSLVKYFIRCANKRSPRLKCTELLLHVTGTVKDFTMCAVYGADYSSILLKDILAVRKYWCEITPQQWEELLTLYSKFYLKPNSPINRLLVARIIHTLTRGCCLQTEGMQSKFFTFFSMVMQMVREETSLPGLDQILSSLNVFLSASSVNCRMRVCKLGEDIFLTVLRVWTRQRPKDTLKEEIVEFFRLMLHVHHPKGARTTDEGAYACDSDKWQRNLYSLYDVMVSEISHIGSRGKYSSGSRHVAVKENLVELMADICHQLFTEDTRMLEITQTSFAVTQREPSGSGAPNKRRRIELGWEVVRDKLQRSHNDFDVIPWLQIAACLIARHPTSLPSRELTPLLTVLHQLLAQQRRGERATFVLRCLKEVAVCQRQKTDVTITPKSDLQKLWTKIWAVALRSISSPQTEAESFALLGVVLQGGLVVADRDFWKVFSGSAGKPSSSTVHCLCLALTSCTVPDHLTSGLEQLVHDSNEAKRWLKEEIIKWLLFGHQDEEMEDNNEHAPLINKYFSHHGFHKAIVSLTMKDSSAAMTYFGSCLECSHHKKGNDDSSFSDTEELYLLSSFNEITALSSVAASGTCIEASSPCLTVHQCIREKLESDLITIFEHLHNNYSSETTPADSLVRCASLMTGVLACYCHAEVISEEDACKTALFQKAKMLMQCTGESTLLLKGKLNEEAKIVSLGTLISQCLSCVCNCTKTGAARFFTNLFLRLITQRMLTDLYDICRSLITSSGHTVETIEEDLMDTDLETRMDVEDQQVVDLFDDHSSTEATESTDYGELQNVTGAVSPLSEEHLTKPEIVLLQTLQFLCFCASADVNHTVNFRPSDIRRKLLNLIDTSLDMNKPLHLRVYLQVLKDLPVKDVALPMDDINTLLKPLPEVCSSYRRDQEVCTVILKSLLPVVLCLGQNQEDTEDTCDADGQLLSVIQAFWLLTREGKYSALVRVALVNCMKTLIEVDPKCNWAILTVGETDVAVRDAFPQFLADTDQQVRFLAAKSASRLFQDVKLQALPLALQQKAFENVYMKVQEGMSYLSCSSLDPEQLPDEKYNRNSTLLMLVSVVLRSSPVCEKQALFAICQSVKENGLDPQSIKKVLEKVSTTLGYRTVKDFMTSHLDYLVFEWLRMKMSGYNLSTFPYTLLNYTTLRDFYRSCYKVLVPHLVIRSEFEEVKSIAQSIEADWKVLLSDCFPRILVNILPYFVSECSGDLEMAKKREIAYKVYDLLQDENCLGKQQIDNLFLRNLPDIVVELLMTLHESSSGVAGDENHASQFTRELDPAPNPPYFPSYVIKATLDYISSCHKSKMKSLVAILSKSPDSFQKILLSICKQAAESNNVYRKHHILTIYHLFVNLLLVEIKDGLGGAWAFVLRDVIYTLIHHINSRAACTMDEVSTRSFMLCLDLLHRVCRAAVTFCKDALESHLHVIVGSLIPLANSQVEIQEQVCELLTFLVVESQDNENLYHTIKLLDPFPDHPLFKNLRQAHQKIKYSKGTFSLIEEVSHFLSVSVCDSLPLTRLEGLNDLRKQLEQHKDEMKDLVRDFQGNPQDNVIAELVLSLLQLCKNAVHLDNGSDVLEAVGSCLGELGPVDFCTIALQHRKEPLYGRAVDVFQDKELQCVLVILTLINNALTDHCIHVRSAAATCLKNILATKKGCQFWEVYKDSGDPMLVYFQPFRTPKKKFLQVEDISGGDGASDSVDDHTLWIPQSSTHEEWIKNLTCAVLSSGGVRSEVLLLLKPMCEVKADFCQAVLPYLIHNILLEDPNSTWRTLLSKHIQGFFTSCCHAAPTSSRSATPASSDSESEGLLRGTIDIASRRTMLSVLEYLRRQRRSGKGTAFDDNFWLDLNYLEVAMAVQSCAAHFTALLYAEIYADKIKSDGEQRARCNSSARKSLKFEEESQTMTIVSMSERSKEETGISLQDLLMEIYRSIGEPDSLYGCGGGKMLHPLARIRTYEHEAMWGKALVTYDLEKNLPPGTRQAGIMQALQNFGLCHMLSTYLRGLEHENAEWSSELQEIRFQAAWRNMQWDQSPSCKNDAAGPGYHESLYRAVQSLRDKEFSTFHNHIKYARVKEVENLCRGSLESVYSLYPTLCRLQAIGELACAGQMFPRPISEHQLNELYMKWQQQSQLHKDSDFGFQEPVLTLRSVILETMLEKNSPSQDCLKPILTKHLVGLSRVSRTASNTQLPEKALFQIKQHNSTQFLVSEWQLEEAQVFWAKKEHSLALGILRHMVDKLESNSFEVENNPNFQLIYVECLRLCGNWLAETCLESPTIIMKNYLEKAVDVAESYRNGSCDQLQDGRMKAFLSLARFSDAQYQRIDNYMKSSEFENKQALLAKAKQEVELMRQHKVQTNRYTIKVQRELELDECEIAALKEDRKRFLCTAMENYMSCLVSGEEHDMWIFRLCSLWLENSGVSEVNSIMKKDSQKIPSHKFLPLMYQLAARMGTKKMGRQEFHEVLNNLISRTCLDHPYHTLFIILALANANKDDLLMKSETVKRGGRLTKNAPKKISQIDEDRMEAACSIVNTIKKHRSRMVRDVERLCDAYITLANMDASQWKAQRNAIPMPSDQPITKLTNLQDVVIPTMELKVDPSGKYENLVTIKSFNPEFRLAGGLNLPKIIDCIGSDGKERRQLVKGRDDLRQDAVMQQVFQMCNTLLQRNSETRRRKLTIRRYKVVPLSQRSGVLEWCSGTVPIGEYLINADVGAHTRYRPSDYSSFQCQKTMMEVQRGRFEDKYQVFLDISDHFRPVFRYFCMEKFLDPAVWFEKRLAYTRSVATSSIVGYIVGLGDRHVQNILIDEKTAELVHIDLGVAFEQGKILPTPETVPFRLTRDIVDGMGITGVEGVFRRCCEKTMEVMRSSQDALLTIVEVLLYDPLFDWTMNPLKALYLQQDEAELNATLPEDPECNRNTCSDTQSFNKVAERVLLRLQEKLKGVEEGTVLTAEGQVNLLIQQAMDPKNLSRLFPGWKAWV